MPYTEAIKNNSLRMVVDLKALEHNVGVIRRHIHPAELSCIIKANAYGMGCTGIALKLYELGCKKFFVANTPEGIKLRKLLPDAHRIYILNGIIPEDVDDYLQFRLTPVLNTLGQLKTWVNLSKKQPNKLPAILHFDTGMHRLGFSLNELAEIQQLIQDIEIDNVISHLAQADDIHHSYNYIQHERFKTVLQHFPQVPLSLAATEGIRIHEDFHYDMVRIGMALYGALPPGDTSPLGKQLKMIFKTEARILQTRWIQTGDSVGYGQTFVADRPTRLAVLGLGFVDGIPRAASNKGHVYIQDYKALIVGRVSMDLTIIDVTDIPEDLVFEGSWVDLIRDSMSLYELAKDADTGVYEIITRLTHRYERIYME